MLESEKTSIEKLRILVLVPEEGAKKILHSLLLVCKRQVLACGGTKNL
jgi:hypothetical protein